MVVQVRGGRCGEAYDAAAASNLAAGPPRGCWPKLLMIYCPQLSATKLSEFNIVDMSRASQITLATTCATAIGVVAFVHFAQQQDKAVSHLMPSDKISDLTVV